MKNILDYIKHYILETYPQLPRLHSKYYIYILQTYFEDTRVHTTFTYYRHTLKILEYILHLHTTEYPEHTRLCAVWHHARTCKST